jgi:hypothetical protein
MRVEPPKRHEPQRRDFPTVPENQQDNRSLMLKLDCTHAQACPEFIKNMSEILQGY